MGSHLDVEMGETVEHLLLGVCGLLTQHDSFGMFGKAKYEINAWRASEGAMK